MMKALLILILCAGNAFAAGSVATNVNNERVQLMVEVLGSEKALAIIDSYGKNGFVFDGMNWLNTNDDSRYYNLRFKKFGLEASGEVGARIFTDVVTICDHTIILLNAQVTGDKKGECSEERSSVSEKDLVPHKAN
jgi:hypothetical protein